MSSAEIENSPSSEENVPQRSITVRLTNRAALLRGSVWSAVMDIASNQAYSHASAIAFNALLSFFPFVILLLLICRKVFQWPEGFEMILALLKYDYLPTGGQFITRNLRVLAANNTTAFFSIAALIFTSSGLFAPIELALNHAWKITEERKFWKSWLIALLLVVACGMLAMGSIYITASSRAIIVSVLGDAIHRPFIKFLMMLLIKILILPVTVAIFFLIYYTLPNRRLPVKRVFSTALFVGLFWEFSKYFFMWCLPFLDIESLYGPFYITVTLVTWAFISAVMLLFGASLSAKWPD